MRPPSTQCTYISVASLIMLGREAVVNGMFDEDLCEPLLVCIGRFQI